MRLGGAALLGLLAAFALGSCGGGGEAIGTAAGTLSLTGASLPARTAPSAVTETVTLTETAAAVTETETVTLTETAAAPADTAPAVTETATETETETVTVTETAPAATTSAPPVETVTVTTTEGVTPAAAAAACRRSLGGRRRSHQHGVGLGRLRHPRGRSCRRRDRLVAAKALRRGKAAG